MTPKPWRRLNPGTWLWPLPAIVAWVLCWTLFRTVWEQGLALPWALALASALGVALSLWGASWWRRALIAAGFPVSLALTLGVLGGSAVPAWAWLLPMALLLAAMFFSSLWFTFRDTFGDDAEPADSDFTAQA